MKRGADWSPVYMIIVVIIAAVLVFTLIKPIFQGASSTASGNLDAARKVAASGLFLGSLLFKR